MDHGRGPRLLVERLSTSTPHFLGFFSALATIVLIVAGVTLLWPDTPLDLIWVVAKEKHQTLIPYGQPVGTGFLLLSLGAVAASVGNFLRREWGRRIAIGGFAANGVGDIAQIAIGHFIEGAIGISVAGALVYYLTRSHVRNQYRKKLERRTPSDNSEGDEEADDVSRRQPPRGTEPRGY